MEDVGLSLRANYATTNRNNTDSSTGIFLEAGVGAFFLGIVSIELGYDVDSAGINTWHFTICSSFLNKKEIDKDRFNLLDRQTFID